MGKGTTKKTKESSVQKEPAAEKLDAASLPELIFDNDKGCIVAKFDDGREPVTVELNGAQFAAAVLKISNEIYCCESKAQEKTLHEELEKKARACREELKNSKVSNTGLNDEINFIINSLKKRKQEGDYPLRYRLICLSSTLNKFLENKKVIASSPELGKRLKELQDFLEKNKNRIESHYDMKELGEDLTRLYKLPVDQNRIWLNKFKECKYFKENKKNENRDYGRVVSNLLSEARVTIETELKKNGINLSVETFLPMGPKRMKYPRKKIQFQGHDPFFEVAEGMLAIKGSSEIILSVDGTEIKFVPEDIEGELRIPEGVKKIEGSVFEKCKRITGIIIPASVISLDVNANIFLGFKRLKTKNNLWNCETLEYIKVAEENPVYKSINGMLFNKDGTELIFVPRGKGGDIRLPEGVTEIGDDAFGVCTGLKSITIPASVTKIGNWAFSDCTGLTTITIPEGITEIRNWTFKGCTGLKSITIPAGVTKIGNSAFSDCTELKSITIPENVTWIGQSAFEGCTGLTNITIPESVTEIGWSTFCGCTGLTSITIPKNVIGIGWSAFSGCTGLKSITIPDSVTSIGPAAFAGCTGLTNITIPESVTEIGWGVFEGCIGLTSIIIPKNVREIRARTFSNCTGLISIMIPECIAEIGDEAFSNCTGLTSITIPESVIRIGEYAFKGCTGLKSIRIPKSVISIDGDIFSDCKKLERIEVAEENTVYKSVSGMLLNKEGTRIVFVPKGISGKLQIPMGITEIGISVFQDCVGLTDITIPEGVTEIKEYAFKGCIGLKSITISASVTQIGMVAFCDCASLMRIYFEGDAPELYTPTFSFDDSLSDSSDALLSKLYEAIGFCEGFAELFNSFEGVQVTVYYRKGAKGWGDTFGGLPTVEIDA